MIDKLTGLFNRWHWDQRAAEALERAGARATALLLVVVDGFPRISNGDEVLRAVSAVLRKTLRTTDLTGRYDDHGGDGFLVLLPARDRQLGELIARRIRARIRRAINLPASVAVAVNDPTTARILTLTELIRQADAAVLQARTAGGDQIVVAGNGVRLAG